MGYTNAVAEFRTAHQLSVMIDNIGIKGPPTQYELPDGTYETISENPGIRQFVWEHAVDVNQFLHWLAHAGATILPKKSQVAWPEINLVRQRLTYEGQLPDSSRVSKILKWPPPPNMTHIRAFLGLCGTMCIWIKKYSELAWPLTELIWKNAPFEWDEHRQEAMDVLKNTIAQSPALITINYKSGRPVIFAVDTSVIAIGYIILKLMPKDSEDQYNLDQFLWTRILLQPIQVGAIWTLSSTLSKSATSHRCQEPSYRSWCQVYQRHAQSPWSPNATLNWWIAGILLFNFTLVHVPAA